MTANGIRVKEMILKRNISFSIYIAWRNYSYAREARILNKIICKGEQKSLKRKQIPKSTSMNVYARNMLYFSSTKRLAALNKVFMEHVSDLTSAGDYGDEFERLGIQVIKTKVSPNLHVLFVYWIPTKPIVENEVEKLLTQVTGYLRFELSTLKVMGEIPEIRFVKHEELIAQETVLKILQDLSFMREIEEAESKKSVNEESVVNENDKDYVVNDDEFSNLDFILSNMKQNVCGLDYPRILQNIVKERTKRQEGALERGNAASHTSTDKNEQLSFNKKMLSKVILKDSYDTRKQRRLNRQLMNTIQDESSSQNAEEEEYQHDEDNEEYDESHFDEEMKRIIGDPSQDADTQNAK